MWEASLLTVGEFNTVQSFARLMNNIRTPARLAKGANYHLFKDGIRPVCCDSHRMLTPVLGGPRQHPWWQMGAVH